MEDYPIHSVKRDPEGSGFLAIRTGFDDGRDWKIVGLSEMQHYVRHADVEHWTDLRE